MCISIPSGYEFCMKILSVVFFSVVFIRICSTKVVISLLRSCESTKTKSITHTNIHKYKIIDLLYF